MLYTSVAITHMGGKTFLHDSTGVEKQWCGGEGGSPPPMVWEGGGQPPPQVGTGIGVRHGDADTPDDGHHLVSQGFCSGSCQTNYTYIYYYFLYTYNIYICFA